MADLRISELPALSGQSLQDIDLLPITDVSASETKKITAEDLIQYGIELLPPGSIPGDKVIYDLPPGSINTAEIADGSVTAVKLSDNSSGVVTAGPLSDGLRIGQLAVDTTDNKLYVWDGSAWIDVKAAGSINTINGDLTGLILIGVDANGDEVTLLADHADTVAPRQFLAGPTASGGPVTQREIVGLDLPLATTADRGAVVPDGTSIGIDAGGVISINNTVAPSTGRSLVEYNAYGLVTDGGPLTAVDLPPATIGGLGAVYPGPSLTVDGDGQLDINNAVTPGTYPKVEVNQYGLVVNGYALEASDLPEISADNIVGGDLDVSGVIPDRSIEEIKLADYSTCQMQEDNPGSGYKLGHLWWQPSTAQLRIFARGSGPENVWRPVGFGALQANNLRWGGVIDANTSTIVSVTSIGISENLSTGQPIPPPSDSLSGMYFVTQVEGNNINQPNVGGTTFTPGDWLLCINDAEGYIHIDAGAAGGGGGGTVNYLDDLLDVEIGGNQGPFGVPRVALADGQYLYYDGNSGMWVNSDVIDGGTY